MPYMPTLTPQTTPTDRHVCSLTGTRHKKAYKTDCMWNVTEAPVPLAPAATGDRATASGGSGHRTAATNRIRRIPIHVWVVADEDVC